MPTSEHITVDLQRVTQWADRPALARAVGAVLDLAADLEVAAVNNDPLVATVQRYEAGQIRARVAAALGVTE